MGLIEMEYDPVGNTIAVSKCVISGYISGSGNYVDFFIPMAIDTAKTYTVSFDGDSSTFFMPNGSIVYYTNANFDKTYLLVVKCPIGLLVELKFASTQTANKPVSVIFNGSITMS